MTTNVPLDSTTTGNESNWTFIGDPNWRQDADGVIYPPVYFDEQNTDHNECMVAEVAPGRLVAFMHEGFRVPGHIRGQFFQVTSERPVAAC